MRFLSPPPRRPPSKMIPVILCLLLLAHCLGETTENVRECTSGETCSSSGESAEASPLDSESAEASPLDTLASWIHGAFADAFGENTKSESPVPNDERKQNGVMQGIETFFKERIFSAADEAYDELSKSFDGAFDDLTKGFSDMLGGFTTSVSSFNPKAEDAEESTMNLIQRARDIANGDGGDARTFRETFDLFVNAFRIVKDAVDRHFGHLDWSKFNILAYIFYLEFEEERKNPIWKRRMHRYFKAVQPREVLELHSALFLAELAYHDTIEDIKVGLSSEDEWELVYAQMEAFPSEPAHFIALKKQQKSWSTSLEVLLSVRGTKEMGDVLSDCFLDAEDYRGGKAHAGIVRSGLYLVEKGIPFLKELLKFSDKKRIKLHIVGHSLGAGAASIAAIEFNDYDFIDASAVGFGCPALISSDIAEKTKEYIVTVVSDADLVPRMSGAAVGNAVLDIMAYDWTEPAVRDVKQLIGVARANGLPISPEEEGRIVDFVMSFLRNKVTLSAREIPTEREKPVLIPPGKCIHFFRDGRSFSAAHTPCSFFDSIEITRTMVADHLTDTGYHPAMVHFMRSYNNDLNFRFAQESFS